MQKLQFKLKLLGLKMLKKLELLKYINFKSSIYLNKNKITVPFVNGIGFTNFVLSKNWIDGLLESFVDKNRTFIDVGVNIGQTLLRVKTLYPELEYLGFEPNSTCTSYTQQLIKINRFKACIIQNCALSDSVANLILEKSYLEDSRASVISSLRPNYFNEKENVLALDYQSFYMDKEISFVKIDVEGAEYEVLKGMKDALVKYKPIIACEVLDSHASDTFDFTQKRATLVSELLKSIDYEIIQLQANEISIITYNKIDTILIKQWTDESEFLNDYLFYPSEKKESVFEKLNNIIKAN